MGYTKEKLVAVVEVGEKKREKGEQGTKKRLSKEEIDTFYHKESKKILYKKREFLLTRLFN